MRTAVFWLRPSDGIRHCRGKNFPNLRQIWMEIEAHQSDILRPVAREYYEYEQYICLEGVSPDKIRNKIEALPDILISRIVSYFNAKYHVSIDSDTVRTVLLPQAPQYSWSKEQTRQYHETMETAAFKL